MSPRKATIDLEFKSYVSGYEESKKKIDDLINSAKSYKSSEAESTSKAIVPVDISYEPIEPQFGSLLNSVGGWLKLIGGFFAVKALKKVLNTLKEIVNQSEIWQSIVKLTLTPFVMMLNLMLLPVLKWIIPKFTEWLTWTMENKDAFDFIGKVLVSIGETIVQIVGAINPFKIVIETIQDVIDIINTDGNSAIGTLGSIAIEILFALDEIAKFPSRIVGIILDALYTIGSNTPIVSDIIDFFGGLFEDIWVGIKILIRSFIENIPIIGEDLANTIFGNESSTYSNPLLGDTLPTLSPMSSTSPVVGTTDYEFIIMNSNINPADIKTPSQPIGNMLKAKLGTT